MKLVEIKGSSNVAAAGFADGVIRVLFHAGRYADYAGRTEADFEELLAAPSKGRFVRERLEGKPATVAADPAGPLDIFQHDPCCGRGLTRARLAGASVRECPRCSVEWIPTPIGDGVRHWKPRVWTAVLR